MQASVQEAVGDEGLLNILDKLVSRIDAKKEPVSGDEVMKVIQRRLFADVGDSAVIQEIALQQAELFRKYRESYEDTSRGKQEVLSQADLLAERIQSSYPFHPDLLDLMYYRSWQLTQLSAHPWCIAIFGACGSRATIRRRYFTVDWSW